MPACDYIVTNIHVIIYFIADFGCWSSLLSDTVGLCVMAFSHSILSGLVCHILNCPDIVFRPCVGCLHKELVPDLPWEHSKL